MLSLFDTDTHSQKLTISSLSNTHLSVSLNNRCPLSNLFTALLVGGSPINLMQEMHIQQGEK